MQKKVSKRGKKASKRGKQGSERTVPSIALRGGGTKSARSVLRVAYKLPRSARLAEPDRERGRNRGPPKIEWSLCSV